MAKVGESDPRWIVQQRNDGKNVNSWHWEERDLSKSSHEALKGLFEGKAVTDGLPEAVTSFRFTSLSEIDGDITVAQRKGKIMCYFEVKATAKWEATVVLAADGEEKKIEGKIVAPEIEHDNFADAFTLNVSAVERGPAADKAEGVAQKGGRAVFRAIVKDYFEALFVQHAVGSKAGPPGTAQADASASPAKATTTATTATATAVAKPAPKPTAPAATGSASSFTWTIDWRVSAEELFLTLTDERRAAGYTRCNAKIDPRPAGTFEFLGGAIGGFYNDIVPCSKITMQWRLSSWEAGVHSSVVIELATEEPGVTRMSFAQAGIPAGEIERVKQGWCVNFFDPIKVMMGFNMTWIHH